MFASPEDQAIVNLNDTKLEIQQREFAIHYIAQHPTVEGIRALVGALQYKEFAIRWVASTALAQLGYLALPEVLKALMDPKMNTAPLREGVIHILHYSSTLAQEPVYNHRHVKMQVFGEPGKLVSVEELMAALKGPSADIASMKAANKLLVELSQSSKEKTD